MDLLELPAEMIEAIGKYLDSHSLLAFHAASPKLQQSTRKLLESLELQEITGPGLVCLDTAGPFIQKLDLSHWKVNTSRACFESVIQRCKRVKELNLPKYSSWLYPNRVFCDLEVLETLRVTNPLAHGRLRALKNLYIEAETKTNVLENVIGLLNSCDSIEVVHINLMGAYGFSRLLEDVPTMEAERWKTLRTVVCSSHLSTRDFARSLLRKIFNKNALPGLQRWIGREQDCFIFENGRFYGAPSQLGEVTSGDLTLLKRYHFVDLSIDGDSGDVLKTPWGYPETVRIAGFNAFFRGWINSWSEKLTELDLTGCHGNFTEASRRSLIASSPSLTALACSLCFFRPPRSENPNGGPPLHLPGDDFASALKKLELKKLSVIRYCCCLQCTNRCLCESDPHCGRCRNVRSLTGTDLIDLSDFRYLEEFSLSGVSVRFSALRRLANSKLRTLRLSFNARNDFSGLEELIQRCESLERLKLEAWDLCHWTETLWKALYRGKNLRHACVKMGSDKEALPAATYKCFERSLRKLEIMHLRIDPDYKFEGWLRARDSKLLEKIVFDYTCSPRRNLFEDRCIMGNTLCLPENSIAVVPQP